jgi:membrane fusion protein, multidrug efflux system
MRRAIVWPLTCAAWVGASYPAAIRAQDAPTVQAQLVDLKKGSLPQIVTAYGSVDASTSSQRTVTAPAAAVVEEIYVRKGQEVEKDAPLLRLMPSPATSSSYAQAQSALRVATNLVERTQKMVEQHLATAQQLAEAEKSQGDARAALAALQAQGAAGANVLHAPSRSIVTAISTTPGTIVTEGAALLSLAEAGGLVVKVGVVPAEASDIKPDDPTTVTPLGAAETIATKVLMRGSMIDSTTGMVPVEIALPPGQFLPGQPASAAITVGEAQGYLVPHEAILVDDNGRPYVVQAVNSTAKQATIHILAANGDQDVIDGPLDPAAPVVLAGNHQLHDGMKVQAAQAADKAAP